MKDESKPSDGVVIECDLPHPPEKVWRALTDQDLVGKWLMPTDLRPEVGARFRLPPAEATQAAPMIDCEVIEAVPPRTLRWRQTEGATGREDSLIESVVTFELLPNIGGTHLRIVHDQFRQVATEAKVFNANVVRFERRKTGSQPLRSHAPRIVCALGELRRAA